MDIFCSYNKIEIILNTLHLKKGNAQKGEREKKRKIFNLYLVNLFKILFYKLPK